MFTQAICWISHQVTKAPNDHPSLSWSLSGYELLSAKAFPALYEAYSIDRKHEASIDAQNRFGLENARPASVIFIVLLGFGVLWWSGSQDGAV